MANNGQHVNFRTGGSLLDGPVLGKGNVNQNPNNNKKRLVISVVLLLIFTIIAIGAYIGIVYIKGQQFIFKVDKVSAKLPGKDCIRFIEGDDKTPYFAIERFATQIYGFKYYRGGYEEANESTNKGYIENIDMSSGKRIEREKVQFEKDSKILKKIYISSGTDYEYELVDLEKPIVKIGEELYASMNDFGRITDSYITYNLETGKNCEILTLPYLVNYYKSQFKNVYLEEFLNQKAILEGLLVTYDVTIENPRNSPNGLMDLNGNTVVGEKYYEFKYLEGSKEFLIQNNKQLYGILSADGSTKIEPAYQELKEMYKPNNLYLARQNGKYGVLTSKGRDLIKCEFDAVGAEKYGYFGTDGINNRYVILDKWIPVQRDGQYIFFDLKGNQVSLHDGLIKYCAAVGCSTNMSKGVGQSVDEVMFINYRKVKALVVGFEDQVTDASKNHLKYNLIDMNTGRLLFTNGFFDGIYSRTDDGDTYYYTYAKDNEELNRIDILQYLDGLLGDIEESDENENEVNEQENVDIPVEQQTYDETPQQQVQEQYVQQEQQYEQPQQQVQEQYVQQEQQYEQPQQQVQQDIPVVYVTD